MGPIIWVLNDWMKFSSPSSFASLKAPFEAEKEPHIFIFTEETAFLVHLSIGLDGSTNGVLSFASEVTGSILTKVDGFFRLRG